MLDLRLQLPYSFGIAMTFVRGLPAPELPVRPLAVGATSDLCHWKPVAATIKLLRLEHSRVYHVFASDES